ncbi:MAG TPA: FtsX-like permease family protein, partial [Candidatus Limnocylindria bacterium]|nr:FtsX-like permease family protein [Candidatus Limnocylindria bacterium]
DAYRNHSVGFVFQTYNLIPHQSVLGNVEIALTLSGVGPAERRQRAKAALEQVGLGDQLRKRPSQLSGGQMQRVAVARALVNDPDVLLADEPTGALDSQTSVQLMETLAELARNRLVVMVTHNQELAERYATRIIRLKDGLVVSDSAPFEGGQPDTLPPRQPKTAMSLGTALSLSFQNLLTKRGRTLLTAFAGSIGIIGIALILAMSTGVNDYITGIQRDTMASYPIVIQREAIALGEVAARMRQNRMQRGEARDGAVYVDANIADRLRTVQVNSAVNDLAAFREWLETPDNPMRPYLTDVHYGYDARFDLYTVDPAGELVLAAGEEAGGRTNPFAQMLPFSDSPVTEMLPSDKDGLPGDAFRARYTLLAGEWPKGAEDVILFVDLGNEISDYALYRLGILPRQEMRAMMEGTLTEFPQERVFRYEELIGKEYSLLARSDYYLRGENGLFTDVREDPAQVARLVADAPRLRVSGIARPREEGFGQADLGYTRALTESVIARAASSAFAAAQQASPGVNVLSGLAFAAADTAQKAQQARAYVAALDTAGKARFIREAVTVLPSLRPGSDGGTNGMFSGSSGMDVSALLRALRGGEAASGEGEPAGQAPAISQWSALPGLMTGSLEGMGDAQLAGLLDAWMASAGEDMLATMYDLLIAKQAGTLEEVLRNAGLVDPDRPSSISLYTDTFERKERVAQLIEEYNMQVDEDLRIVYTDFVALIISNITTIINVMTYVLIAFVAVSLVVSSIMIGIITYISVLERTKEIGILRAVGASRRDVRRVFTAEALIIGITAGVLGVLLASLLTIPINVIVRRLAGDENITASLPLQGAALLVAISAALSWVAGWLPARMAAKRDPVVALRSE